MSETVQEAPQEQQPAQAETAEAEPAADWQAKFKGQLKVNRDLEQKLVALRGETESLLPLKQQFEALRGVFGDKAEGEKPEDAMRSLQTQVEQLLQRDAVNALARIHGITDETDIARLARIADPELREDLAARLKPTPAAPAAPQADPGQGARPGARSSRDDEYQKFFPNTR